MDIRDFFKELEGFAEHIERKEEEIGRINDPEIIALHDELVQDKREIQEDLELRTKELELKAERILKDEFRIRMRRNQALHDRAWNKIYDQLGVDRNKEYKLNRKTGQVFEISKGTKDDGLLF